MGKYFGTDGFRGEANVTLTASHAYKIGRFLGWCFGKGKEGRAKGVIGKDTRRSSYMLEYALAAGMAASGADPHLLHVTTTPSVSYITRCDGFDFGVMISASHNPYYDNGIKLFDGSGEKMGEEILTLCEAYLDGMYEIPYALGENIGKTVDYLEGRRRYVGHLISLASYSLAGYRIGLDSANGSTWQMAKEIFDTLGAKTYVIGASPNGVNINHGCGSTHIEALQKLVLQEGLDLGFAFDGDGDRLICVDGEGGVVDGDGILYILAQDMQEMGNFTQEVVGTLMTNRGLELSLAKRGISLARTSVGDRFVYEYMRENGSALGGEPSGHIILSKYATTGDGLLTALKLLEVVQKRKKPLKECLEGLCLLPLRQMDIPTRVAKETLTLPWVQEEIALLQEEIGNRGRLVVRASGTEPKIRVMCEGEDMEMCEGYCQRVKTLIQSEDR